MTRHRDDGLPHWETVIINCRIPRALHEKIMLLMIDPTTGKMPVRGWSKIIQEGMELWLERRQAQPDPPPKDEWFP